MRVSPQNLQKDRRQGRCGASKAGKRPWGKEEAARDPSKAVGPRSCKPCSGSELILWKTESG